MAYILNLTVCYYSFSVCSLCTCTCAQSLQSCPTLYNSMDCTCQVPVSMVFSKQDYWSGMLFPSPRDLPDPRIKSIFSASPALQADSLPIQPPRKPLYYYLLSAFSLGAYKVRIQLPCKSTQMVLSNGEVCTILYLCEYVCV